MKATVPQKVYICVVAYIALTHKECAHIPYTQRHEHRHTYIHNDSHTDIMFENDDLLASIIYLNYSSYI